MKTPEWKDKIEFSSNYNSFGEFMDECRDSIYKSLFRGYEEMKQAGSKKGRLAVNASVEDTQFESILKLSRDDTGILTDIILPFFAENEEYELCAKIVAMCEETKKH